ncbi:Geranylfarnesyl diphosphate synthase [uncultured archaeon]|nr:Geranylfarnesyl diphosphate synthase [uncultured archaeon]
MFAGWDEYRLINREISRLVAGLPKSDLGEVISYVLTTPGKRVRPLILIFSSQAFGGDAGKAANAALAVELVHAASLVHDDILDAGRMRRGSPSTILRYGPEAALLAGDYLISKSIELISQYSQPVITTFAHSCMSMSEGEMLDLSRASSYEDYYACISRKTASLFAASATIGCLIAKAPAEEVARLESYGMHLGLAYQILDDLEEHLGIDQGKASGNASVTLPNIYGRQHTVETAVQMCIKAIYDNCSEAKLALDESSGNMLIKDRLLELIDRMTLQGLNQCRSQVSLC